MTKLRKEIDRLTVLVKQRREICESGKGYIPPELWHPDINYLTDEERRYLHELKQSLPSAGVEVARARERLKRRVAARRNRQE